MNSSSKLQSNPTYRPTVIDIGWVVLSKIHSDRFAVPKILLAPVFLDYVVITGLSTDSSVDGVYICSQSLVDLRRTLSYVGLSQLIWIIARFGGADSPPQLSRSPGRFRPGALPASLAHHAIRHDAA